MMQQGNLGFTQHIEQIRLDEPSDQRSEGAEVLYQPDFLEAAQATDLFEELLTDVEWQEETLWITGQERKVPRLIGWYGDQQAEYEYSGLRHRPLPWIQPLQSIRERLQAELGCEFNSVLCNLYRDGQDSVSWHADDERELGREPVIASISLGQARTFQLKHKTNSKLRHKMTLTSGSLLVMQGTTQQYWLHQVPKEPTVSKARINLTFRQLMTKSK